MDQAISPVIAARHRRRTLAAIASGLALVCGAAWGVHRYASPSASAHDIAVAQVRRGDIANSISATGVVVPEREETVPSPIPSRIAHLHAKPGQQVAAGELLLTLDDSSVRVAIASLNEQLAQQENRMAGLRVELEQKRKQIRAAIELLELDLQSARAELSRSQLLRKAGGISGEDMLTAELNVQRIEVQLRQQRDFIERFTRVVKMPAPELRPADIGVLVDGIVALYREPCRSRGITLAWGRRDAVPPLPLDSQLMEQALLNVVKNAMEAVETTMREQAAGGGSIALSLQAEEGGVRLSVTDSRRLSGVPASQLFTPFFSTKKGGQGIGLLFVREVLNRHGYSHRLAADARGDTCFEIWLTAPAL